MKFLQIFTKTPNYKKFNYAPRFYNAEEEERKERNRKIALDLEQELHAKEQTQRQEEGKPSEDLLAYRARMQGSFRSSRIGQKQGVAKADTSATMLRLFILLVLALGLILYLEFGNIALYGLAVIFIPLYIFSKFRNLTRKPRE